MAPGLSAPPFSDHRVYYSVHRHVLRVSQSYAKALRKVTAQERRLYIIAAADDVKPEDQARFTDGDRDAALRIANLRHIKRLSG